MTSTTTPIAIATAFSEHRFAEALPHLDPGVRWRLVGGPTLVGPDAVREACEATAAELAGATTTFSHLRVIDAGATVVVDATATYAGSDGTSTVASCDIYDVADGRVVAITSYTVELPADAEG